MALLMLSEGWGMCLFALSLPFLVFSFIDITHYKKKAIPLKNALIPFILSLTIAVIGSNMIPNESKTALNEPVKLEEQSEQERQAKSAGEQLKLEQQVNLELKAEEEKHKAEEEAKKSNSEVKGQLKVHYIDVGQGDSILVHTNDVAMLIDAGERGYGPGVVNYIKDQGINKLDYLILTHPHADHIGGATYVINAFDIGKIIMPKASHTSQTFENLLTTIQNKGMKITSPNPGDEYQLGSAKFIIVAPNSSSYNDLNDYSVVCKVVFADTSFLFTGDAESISENEIINKGFDIKADILKVGHHGSDSSTTEQFLKTVSPKYAIISCGKGNQYGHPTQAVLNRLAANNVELYRTDESGTIVATSDGKTITFDKKASPIKQNAPPEQERKAESTPKTQPQQEAKSTIKSTPTPETDNVQEVYITNTGEKYHRSNCRYLRKSKIPISLSKAKSSGYEPCKVCSPPR